MSALDQNKINELVQSNDKMIVFGQKVSELDQSLYVQNTQDSQTWFLLSRQNQNGTYSSYRVSYQSILDKVYEDFKKSLGLGTMSTHSESEYAKSYHIHDYTKCEAVSYYPKNSGDVAVTINGVNLNYPDDEVAEKLGKFDIGEMVFIANRSLPTNQQINQSIQNGTFNGWVYPDGSRFRRYQGQYDFSDAYSIFKGSSNYFNVPTFQNFFKLDNSSSPNTDFFNYNNGLSSHSHLYLTNQEHQINKDINVQLDLVGKTESETTHKGSYFHVGYKTWKDNSMLTAISLPETDILGGVSYPIKNTVTSESEDRDDIETVPLHNTIPAMIYIGTRRI